MSFISSDQACANAEEEIPGFNFDKVRAASRSQWSELLGRFQVDTRGVDAEIVDLFYSSAYRTHLSPADCGWHVDPACNIKDRHDICSDTGENPLWNSTEPYYDSFYCNVCYHARPSSIYTDVRHTVGHLSHVIPFHGIARSGDFRKDSPRHDQHSTA